MHLFVLLAGGLELFTELLQRFPNNIHVLLEMAKVRDGFVLSQVVEYATWSDTLPTFFA